MNIDRANAALAPSRRSLATAFRRLITTLLLLPLAAMASPSFAAGLAVISDAWVANHDEVTRVSLSLSAPVPYQVFTLGKPHRAVIDLTNARWAPSSRPPPSGLFLTLRHGRFKPDSYRVVIECRDAVDVTNAALIPSASGGYRLIVDLVAAGDRRAPSTEPGRVISREQEDHVAASKLPKVGGSTLVPVVGATGLATGDIGPPSTAPAEKWPRGQAVAPARVVLAGVRPKPRPLVTAVSSSEMQWVVALDPGHGGQDPGAISLSGHYEKQITFAVARVLRDELKNSGRYKVVLTRGGDRFIRLRDRIAIARTAGADIFISLHADTMPDYAVRGLSVYTLSERAFDAEAAALAERENKVDLIGGIKLAGQTPEVTNILIDLIQRETMNDSARFASLLVDEMQQETMLLPRTHRFAGFAVLKAPDVPSVLIELGYLSNHIDEQLLRNSAYRQRLAQGIARAIDRYFVRYEARNRH